MATEAYAPLAPKSEEQAAMLTEYILHRYDSSTAHHHGVSNAAAGPLAELARLCHADGCARAEQSYHSHSSAPAAMEPLGRRYMHETGEDGDIGKRGPSQHTRDDTLRHQTTATVLRSLLALVTSTSASTVMVPTRKPSDRGDITASDNRGRVKPPPPPLSPPPPTPPHPQPQPSSGNGDSTPSNNHSGLQQPSPPPPPPPKSQSQPPPMRTAAAAVGVTTAYSEAVHPMRSGGNEGVDPSNFRRTLFDGVLRLLEEVVVGNEGAGGKLGREPECVRRKIGGAAKGLLWDIVVHILSDRWSEIRKMGANHARSLATAVGPTEARVLYLRFATRCEDALGRQRFEHDRDWTRVHGFLLGMRATIEGAAESSTCVPKNGNPTTGEGERLVDSPLTTGTPTLVKFTDDVKRACEAKEASRALLSENNGGIELPVESMPCEAYLGPSGRPLSANPLVCTSDETPKSNEQPCITLTPQARQLPPAALLPPAPPSTETVFSCLSHRQAAVREAAVQLLYALARFLGLQTALALYDRTIEDLLREKKRAETVAMRGRGGEGFDANARRSGLEKVGSRAEDRRSYDRCGGLLGLLERIVDVVPPETVGKSWGRMLPFLRWYIGHPEASLRQSAGAVLLRISTAGETPASSPIHVPPVPASTISDPASPAGNIPRVARHTSARIVLWALICALKDPLDEAERTTPRRQPAVNNSKGKSNMLPKMGKGGEVRLRGLKMEQPEDLHITAVGGEGVKMQPGMVVDRAGLEVDSDRQESSARSDEESTPRCSGGAPVPASNGGGCLAAGGTAGENDDECNSSDGGRVVSWEKHEGVLMVCEGVLKSMVDESTAETVFSGGGGSRVSLAAAVETQPAVTAAGVAVDSVTARHHCGWPTSLVNATPLLSDLLLSLERLAEGALFKSERKLREHSASSAAQDDDGKRCSTEMTNKSLRASPGGFLELWRAGSQILPSIARAMVLWNPAAVRGACERAAQSKTDIELARRTSPSLLLLRRRTRLSVACELLRASVRYARHLAETLTDQVAGDMNHIPSQPHSGRGSNSSPKALQAGPADVVGVTPDAFAGSAASPRCQELLGGSVAWAAGTVTVSITNRERWGGSTEGIADSGVGGQSFPRLPVVTTRSSLGSTAAEEAEVVNKNAAATVARIVRDTLALCCEAPPLLAHALAGVTKEKETPNETGERTPRQSTGCPVVTLTRPKKSGGKCTRLLGPQWVFTGVVEAIILARSFRATTVCFRFSEKPSSYNHPRGSDAEHRLDSSPTFADVEPAGEAGTPLPDPHVATPQYLPTTHAIHSTVQRQLHLLHQVVSPTLAPDGRAAETQPTVLRGEVQPCTAAAAIAHECFKSDVSKREPPSSGGGSAGAASESSCGGGRGVKESRLSGGSVETDPAPTQLAIPFSWGSLPLVRVPPYAGRIASSKTRLSYHGRKDTRAAAVGEPAEMSETRPSQTVRKAAQLDRLLSARVVRAMPGYVSSLPPQTGLHIVPTLLRWIEASDHKLRWISVTPLEAHELLLLAISIALQDARVVDRRDGGELHPSSEASPRPLHGSAPTPAASGAVPSPEMSNASSTRQQREQRKQQQQQKQQQREAEEVIVRGTVETLSRMLGSSTRLIGGSSLFCQMCEVTVDAVDILGQLRAVAAVERQPCCSQLVDQYHRLPTIELHGNCGSSQRRDNCRNTDQDGSHTGDECVRCCGEERFSDLPVRLHASFRSAASSEVGPKDGAYDNASASCVHDETMESAANSLLRDVAIHLVRWYKVGLVGKESDSGTCGTPSGCVRTEGRSSPQSVSTASGPQKIVDVEGVGGKGRATSGSSSGSSGGCVSTWDDWDDDDDASGGDGIESETMRGGGEGGGGGDVDERDVSNLKAGGVGYSSTATEAAEFAVLRSAAALIKSVAVFMTMVVSTTSSNLARSPGTKAREEGSFMTPTPKPSPSSPQTGQRAGSSVPSTFSSRECTEEAKCVSQKTMATGTGVIDASSSSTVAEETRHHQGEAAVDGDDALIRLLEERCLGALPVEHRQALFLAWRLGFSEKKL